MIFYCKFITESASEKVSTIGHYFMKPSSYETWRFTF